MDNSSLNLFLISDAKASIKCEFLSYCGAFPDFEDAAWLEPVLVCTAKFMEYTPDGGLHQPTFKGLRDDKTPEKCVIGKR